MNEIIEEYKVWLEIQGKSKNTIKTYSGVIKKFLEFLINNGIIITDTRSINDSLDKNLILKFLAEIKVKKKLDSNSLRLYVRAISSFLKFLDNESLAKQIKAPKVDKRLPKFITYDELNKLLENAENYRDKLIIKFLFYTGVRVSELIKIKKNDIIFEEGFVKVYGKGGKERIVPIPKDLLNELKDYINKINTENIFPLSSRQVERIIKNVAKKAGINKKVTPHVLRHSLATTLLSKGVDIRYIQEILGHSSLNITQIYTHVVPNQLKEIYNKVFENQLA
ncbi:site-specific tyrosine recombinase/integron integrase [Candidatus Nanobsidianus stetteri]|uniref:Tyrosine-type recombinase/integrase n=1 Tax=Nanobsidianus stetteri TaxID=1294122 RepID=A0A2T9WLS2_NANST|nr:site-specific tyrosine recombinase/integron integrase [Candidatus Nanobsidianus stetteri]MCC5447017.1 tyrosine-type recombinase/integrase [Candidatus Nanobsidianus stetteri]